MTAILVSGLGSALHIHLRKRMPEMIALRIWVPLNDHNVPGFTWHDSSQPSVSLVRVTLDVPHKRLNSADGEKRSLLTVRWNDGMDSPSFEQHPGTDLVSLTWDVR